MKGLVMAGCICYVIDDNYLFPTLVSATQAKKQINDNTTDVFIFCVSSEPSRSSAIASVAKDNGVFFVVVAPSVIENRHPMFGRLFIHKMLPRNYNRVIYVDGDTQVKGSLQPLIEIEIPSGKFLAVRDPDSMFARASSKLMKTIKASRKLIGIDDYDKYFNSGVLIFNLKDWEEISKLTLTAFDKISGKLMFPDQDALNMAVGDRCIYISNKWNFPGFLIGSAMERKENPVVYHFMSNPRPWIHAVSPWGSDWKKPYEEAINKNPSLSVHLSNVTFMKKLKYWIQQKVKMVREYGPVGNASETKPDIEI